MTEVRIVPRVRTETKAIHTPVSKCGDNWFKQVRIRSPYRGTDVAYRTLPSLGEPGQIESFDPVFLEEAAGDLKRITDFVHQNSNALTARQLEHIGSMLDRAGRYLQDAAFIAESWANGFATTTVGTIPAWPLDGQPRRPVNKLMEEGHRRDQEKYKKLVRSAMKNLRCAEEVAKKATIRRRNKARHTGRRFSNTAQLNPQGSTPTPMPSPVEPVEPVEAQFNPQGSQTGGIDASSMGGAAEFDPSGVGTAGFDAELEEGDIDLEDGEDEEVEEDIVEEESPPPPAKKKKDNTLLFAGVAALGVLALRK